jgi:hypothetical protein
MNFFLDVTGESSPLVIRVEERHDLGDEADLQHEAVSEYFSEDYVIIMLPFKDKAGAVHYQPVAITQYASEGDWSHYSESLASETSEVKGQVAQQCFSQLSDFLIKLEASGHYHPDIKLSNFLNDKGRVICGDRKTLLKTEQAPIDSVLTSPRFAPPEFLSKVIVKSKSGMMISINSSDLIDMPSFMQFQVGCAISEYLQNTAALQDDPQSSYIKNLFALGMALTQDNPQDRLTLQAFNQLLKHLDQAPNMFLIKLEKHHPANTLSYFNEITQIERLLMQDAMQANDLEKLSSYIKKIPDYILKDPRFYALQTRVKNKVEGLEEQLRDEDREAVQPELSITRQVLTILEIMLDPHAKEKKQLHASKTEVSDFIPNSAAEEGVSGTFLRTGDADAGASGTLIRHPVVEDKVFGTFLRTGAADAGADDSDKETEQERYSPVSDVSVTFSNTQSKTKEQSPEEKKERSEMRKRFARALDAMRAEEEEIPKQKVDAEADDIKTTIHRGDAPKKKEDDDSGPSTPG